jgi:hypothetical protein
MTGKQKASHSDTFDVGITISTCEETMGIDLLSLSAPGPSPFFFSLFQN